MIWQTTARLMVALMCMSLAGCGRQGQNEPPLPDPEPVEAPATQAPPAEHLPEQESGEAALLKETQQDVEAEAAHEPESPPTEVTEAVSIQKALPAADARFLLLTQGGPLVIDVTLVLNGREHDAALAALVDKAWQAADTDGDGRPTWEEVVANPQFRYGLFGNLQLENADQEMQLRRLYDRDADGEVDRDELPRFVTRNAGGAQVFSLRSSNEFRTDNRSRSPLRLLVDADRDGAITAGEMQEAPRLLARQDSNDDGIVTVGELQGAEDEMPGQMSNRRRTNEPDTAVLLSGQTNWSAVQYALEELYSYGDQVKAGDWPLTPTLFAALDQNGNAQVDASEIRDLSEVESHLHLEIRFGETGSSSQPLIRLLATSESLAAQLQAQHAYANRVSLVTAHCEVEFFVNEDPSIAQAERVAAEQFALLDQDSNQYLDEDELSGMVAGLNIPLSALDRDGDGQAVLEDLVYFLSTRQEAFRGQVRARAADQRDALFSALDQDGNGRLTTRELAQSAQILAQLDRDGDGRLQSHEIPGSMVVGFVRGNPEQDNALLVMPATSLMEVAELPDWFRGMDANGDGEVSAREFLGQTDQFSQMDRNADGFLTQVEVQP